MAAEIPTDLEIAVRSEFDKIDELEVSRSVPSHARAWFWFCAGVRAAEALEAPRVAPSSLRPHHLNPDHD